MSTTTYMTSIQVDVFDVWNSSWKAEGQRAEPSHSKVYYDLVELSPDQIKAVVRMITIVSRGIYDSRLPKPLEDQVTGKLNVDSPE